MLHAIAFACLTTCFCFSKSLTLPISLSRNEKLDTEEQLYVNDNASRRAGHGGRERRGLLVARRDMSLTGIDDLDHVGNVFLSWRPNSMVYNHLAKAGGRFVKDVLTKTIPSNLLDIENAKVALTHEDKRIKFTIGGVRNPCDYYPSLWVEQATSDCDWGASGHCFAGGAFTAAERSELLPDHQEGPFNSTEDIRRFQAFLRNISHPLMNLESLRFWGSYVHGGQEILWPPGPKRSFQQSTVSDYLGDLNSQQQTIVLQELQQFNVSSISCWLKTENLEEDLRTCLEAYEEHGGQVDWNDPPDISFDF